MTHTLRVEQYTRMTLQKGSLRILRFAQWIGPEGDDKGRPYDLQHATAVQDAFAVALARSDQRSIARLRTEAEGAGFARGMVASWIATMTDGAPHGYSYHERLRGDHAVAEHSLPDETPELYWSPRHLRLQPVLRLVVPEPEER